MAVSIGASLSPTNMVKHLETRHKALYGDILIPLFGGRKEVDPDSKPSAAASRAEPKEPHPLRLNCIRATARLILKRGLPWDIVEDEEWRARDMAYIEAGKKAPAKIRAVAVEDEIEKMPDEEKQKLFERNPERTVANEIATAKELLQKATSDTLKKHIKAFLEQKEKEAIQQDAELVSEMVKAGSGDALTKHLQAFLKDPGHERKRRRKP
jgi:hypothetical protein